MPKVTVLMSVYNGDRYLLESIESILNQTFEDFEILIINDGSTDKTREIILSINDLRIRLIDNEQNFGLTRSLNKGLRLARGEFVARQDADDISEPERLHRQISFLEAYPETALLGTWHKEIDANGNLIGMWDLPSNWTQIRWSLLFYTPFVHSSIMMRKSIVLQQVGFYNEALSYSQDYELWSRTAKILPVFSLNERLVKTRMNPFSMTATYENKTLEGFQIRASTVAHLLKLDKIDIKLKEMHLNQITTYLFNFSYDAEIDFRRLNIKEINEIIGKIFDLHEAFCQSYKLNEINSNKHRAEVHAQVIDRLLSLIRHYIEQDKRLTLQLLIRVFCLHHPILLTRDYSKLILISLIGPQTARTLKGVMLGALGR